VSRGYRLDDPWSYRYFEVCRELGIRNIHVHKGPTIRPLDRDAFDVADVGNLVGSYNDLCDLMALAARGAVTLHTQKYALTEFQSAIDDLDAGRVRGRAILTP